MRIEITAEDIKNGLPKRALSCPIALATKRALPGIQISVEPRYINTYGKSYSKRYSLPIDATDFIFKFDGGEDVEPFSFEVIL